MHEAMPRRDATHLKRGGLAANDEDGRAPLSPGGIPPSANVVLRTDLYAVGHEPGFDIAPQRNEKLARHRHDRDPPRAAGEPANALAEPNAEHAVRLVAQP